MGRKIKLPKSLLKVLFPKKKPALALKASSHKTKGAAARQHGNNEPGVSSASAPASHPSSPPTSPPKDVAGPKSNDEPLVAGSSPVTVTATLTAPSDLPDRGRPRADDEAAPANEPAGPAGGISRFAADGPPLRPRVRGDDGRPNSADGPVPVSAVAGGANGAEDDGGRRVPPLPSTPSQDDIFHSTHSMVDDDRLAPSSNAEKVQLSARGDEGRRRSFARQKRIPAEASLGSDAISNTSLEGVGEAEREGTTPPEAAPTGSHAVSDGTSSEGTQCAVDTEEGGQRMASPGMVYDQEKETLPPTVREETEQVSKQQADEEGQEKQIGQLTDTIRSELQDCKPREGPSKINIQFFILLLCPTSRIFELIEISAVDTRSDESTVGDIVKLIPKKCTDDRLLRKEYRGFVRPSDRVEFVEPHAKAFVGAADGPETQPEDGARGEEGDFWPSLHAVHEHDVLVAIIEGYSGYQTSKISKPILKNSKFREMIRRRSRRVDRGGGDEWGDGDGGSISSNGSARSSRRRRHGGERRGGGRSAPVCYGGSKSSRSLPPTDRVPADVDSNRADASSVISGVTFGNAPGRSDVSAKANDKGESDKYSSLCRKLEHLSKELHGVDAEFAAGDAPPVGGGLSIAADDATEAVEANGANFKMTPRMMVHEITSNIEDIFADHDVEIVAVDARDDGGDDDTFATARSRRSTKSTRSTRSRVGGPRPRAIAEDDKPLLEITTRKRPPRGPRRSRPSKYGSYEEDDMVLRIEAMARQADAAFEGRRSRSDGGGRAVGAAVVAPTAGGAAVRPRVRVVDGDDEGTETTPEARESTKGAREGAGGEAREETDGDEKRVQRASVSFADEIVVTPDDDAFDAAPSAADGASPDGGSGAADAVSTRAASGPQNALSRNFLDASTSVVSTIVAASHGRVNEVHVLQYLSATVVCIVANFMQQHQGDGGGLHNGTSSGGGTSAFGASGVFQSAMFLAFMVNGQRYLAKITKK